jgi:hypothetical protein
MAARLWNSIRQLVGLGMTTASQTLCLLQPPLFPLPSSLRLHLLLFGTTAITTILMIISIPLTHHSAGVWAFTFGKIQRKLQRRLELEKKLTLRSMLKFRMGETIQIFQNTVYTLQ